MDAEYPPLPAAPQSSGVPTDLKSPQKDLPKSVRGHSKELSVAANGSKIIYRILARDGDVVLEYVDSAPADSMTTYRWQVPSGNLVRNSPFFAAMLDPTKFAEGARFGGRKRRATPSDADITDEPNGGPSEQSLMDDLPIFSLNICTFSGKNRIDALELFLKILCFGSLADDDRQSRLVVEVREQPVSVIAMLLDISDTFSSTQIVIDTLKRAKYVPTVKGKTSLTVFSPPLLKLGEERIRQIIYIAMCLDENTIFRVLTHTLVLLGSAAWVDGAGVRDITSRRWSYLPNGIEEELYRRRQFILNTITDIQAHFLRAYGALEEEERKDEYPPHGHAAGSSRQRPIQCRLGYSNSRACDSFHLGEMIRFFSLRSKTIFLGSTLIDPDFDVDGDCHSIRNININEEEDDEEPVQSTPNRGATTDILSIIASLRQIPDYQLDPSHTGCGIRRQLLPVLDCVDRFVSHVRGVVGLSDPSAWKRPPMGTTTTSTTNAHGIPRFKQNPNSWSNRGLIRAEIVEIHGSNIMNIYVRQTSSSSSSSITDQHPRLVESNGNQRPLAEKKRGAMGKVTPLLSPSSSSSSTSLSSSSSTTTLVKVARPLPIEREAWFLFTAKKRIWGA